MPCCRRPQGCRRRTASGCLPVAGARVRGSFPPVPLSPPQRALPERMPGIAAWRPRGDEGPRPLRRGRQWSRYRTGGRRTGGSPSFSCPATSAGRARTALSVQGAGRRHACGPYGSRPQKRPQASTAKGERTAARRAGSSATEDGRETTGRQTCLQHAIPKRLRGKASAVRKSRESGRVTPAGPAGSVRACPGAGADGTHDSENAAKPLREQGAPGKGGECEEGPFPAGARARRAGAFEGGPSRVGGTAPSSKIRRYPQ